MTKFFFLIIIFIFHQSCSFDTKTGIWNKKKEKDQKNYKYSDSLKDIFPNKNLFKEDILPNKIMNISLSPILINSNWEEIYLNDNNKYPNFNFKNSFEEKKISKKITRKKINKNILYKNDQIFYHDKKGSIYIYSLIQNEVIFKYNFYKKKIKKFEVKLEFLLKDNLLFVADNLGYVYCFDYQKKILMWAKNYKIPFFSNIKTKDNIIFLVNENNDFLALDTANGNLIWNFVTDKNLLQTNFKNNLAIEQDNIYLLNNNGSLYSLRANNAQLNWILSFKEVIGGESSNLFYAFPLIINSEDLMVSTNKSISLYNRQTATIKWKIDIALKIQPIFSEDLIFLFSDENFITCVNSNNGTILWSRNIFALLRESFENSKKNKVGEIINLKIADDKIFLFTDNSNVIQMDPFTSKIISINNISSKITSNPLFLNDSFYFLDKKNRFIEIN